MNYHNRNLDNHEATVIDEAYGLIWLRFADTSTGSQSYETAVSYWDNTIGYMRGGTRTHDVEYYKARIAEMEGRQVRGWVVKGPAHLRGKRYTATLETDSDRIEDILMYHYQEEYYDF
jgi:hypothetical protein